MKGIKSDLIQMHPSSMELKFISKMFIDFKTFRYRLTQGNQDALTQPVVIGIITSQGFDNQFIIPQSSLSFHNLSFCSCTIPAFDYALPSAG